MPSHPTLKAAGHDRYDLVRFVGAQAGSYSHALDELANGRKRGHWMWFVFPQLTGLGSSTTARYYAISGLPEAISYLDHPVLGSRLREISTVVARGRGTSAEEVFGSIDSVKLRSSMTLFRAADGAEPVFQQVLDRYFDGEGDRRTDAALQMGDTASG